MLTGPNSAMTHDLTSLIPQSATSHSFTYLDITESLTDIRRGDLSVKDSTAFVRWSNRRRYEPYSTLQSVHYRMDRSRRNGQVVGLFSSLSST